MRLTARGRRLRDTALLIVGMTVLLAAMGYAGYVEGLS